MFLERLKRLGPGLASGVAGDPLKEEQNGKGEAGGNAPLSPSPLRPIP